MTQERPPGPVSALTLLAALALGGCAGSAASAPRAERPPPAEPQAAVVLREWDQRRAAAYATGDVDGLSALYAEGSAAGAADVRLLLRYVDRNLVVRGMRMQVLSLDVLRSTSAALRLRVTDRLWGAEALDGSRVVPLPRDRPTTRVVRLRRVEGEWKVASVSG